MEFAGLVVLGRTVIAGQLVLIIGFGVFALGHQINFPQACDWFVA